MTPILANRDRTAATAEEIAPHHWRWVEGLIADIEADNAAQCFHAALAAVRWHVAIQEFNKLEVERMALAEPTLNDLRGHKYCLDKLIAAGEIIANAIEEAGDAGLQGYNMTLADFTAYIDDLRQRHREWHHEFTGAEVLAAQTKIFGATA